MQPSNHNRTDGAEPVAQPGTTDRIGHRNFDRAARSNAHAVADQAKAASRRSAADAKPHVGGKALSGTVFAGRTPNTRVASAFAALLLAFALAFSGLGCAGLTADDAANSATGAPAASQPQSSADDAAVQSARATIADIPAYTGALCIDINGGMPGFTQADVDRGAFMQFSELDFEGRCGEAFARIGTDTVSSEKRGDISSVHPSGWVQRKYDFVDDGMLYNRCHLIAHQLCGENANERNLITGTRTFNVVGMLYYEELVGDYVRVTGNHVLYRVTPLFAANDLVARGVQMEAKSIEDDGEAVQFNVFVYNVEPGVAIDYVTGESQESSDTPAVASKGEATITTAAAARAVQAASGNGQGDASGAAAESHAQGFADSTASGNASSAATSVNDSAGSASAEQHDYVLNVKNKKFHLPSCSAVSDMSTANRQDFTGTRDELIERGYSPCGTCNP